MAIICIDNLRVDTIIGVHPWERRVKQTLHFDLQFSVDLQQSASSDTLADTVDYDAVARCVREQVSSSEYQLLEALAEQLCQGLVKNFALSWLQITISKPGALANSDAVRLVVEHGQPPANQ